MPSNKVSEEFGKLAFTDAVMQQRLPRPTYKELHAVIKEGGALNLDIANEVAHAMKDWALEHGATHYAHWFQPLTGLTSEKHDSFLMPLSDGTALMMFSGKELVQSESDASSFPNGGLRATFEARGYTAWDPTSPAFLKDGVLCIPTAFVAYTGEALDKKTPLLRSTVALDKASKRVLALFGKTPKRVESTVGPEQEYFLIKKEAYAKRPDLIMSGRTLFGAPAVKGQELSDHYFGSIRKEVNAYMKDLNDELWKRGVPVTTKHNEVAPCQHELAPLYENASVAIDHNLLTMEIMKTVAAKHGFACLEHEKPFAYVNGSGKHDNWSLSADGKNLLEPGDAPEDNLQFLVFLTCVIAAVDRHQDLLRVSVASLGNDQRLGGNEAPPSIISIFLGSDLEQIVHAIIHGENVKHHEKTKFDFGVPQLADIMFDTTDRNRTSPFAFTGNKFEFRMCGSRLNLADPNMILNTAVSEALTDFANALETVSEKDSSAYAMRWIKETLTRHGRIIFSGNGYSASWEKEAEKRGLIDLKTTADALGSLITPQNVAFFSHFDVLDEAELCARYVSKGEQYCYHLQIEAETMLSMVVRLYLPALESYAASLADNVAKLEAVSKDASLFAKKLELVLSALSKIDERRCGLKKTLEGFSDEKNLAEKTQLGAKRILPLMKDLRDAVDSIEPEVPKDIWPVPSYNDLLFYL